MAAGSRRAAPALGAAREKRVVAAPGAASLYRRILDDLVWLLARVLAHVFFRQIDRTGAKVPRGGPLVLVANHNNSVVDAVLLSSLSEVRPRMLAKSPLFSHPVMGPLLALAGALPVYRRQDPGSDLSRNFESFGRCRDALAAGSSIAIFPEGASHSDPQPRPLKTGAARIVLEAEAEHARLGIRLVPVGLRYQAKDRFRSRVQVDVGPAIDPTPEAERYREAPRAAVRALTQRISAGLASVARGGFEPSPRPAPQAPLVRAAAFPLLVLGCALNWLPYRLPGFVSARLSRMPDDPATYKLLAGLLSFPIVWGAEALLAWHLGGAAWALGLAFAAPASGYAALRIREMREA